MAWQTHFYSKDTSATIEELQEAVVSVQSMLRLYNENQRYQSHDSRSRKTVKYGHESCRARNEE
jgi:hypothetical protein